VSGVQSTEPVVWIPDTELQRMVLEADRRFPLETGGVLTGYVRDHQYVIERVIGPGPIAVHHACRFEPDHAWQCREIDRVFDETRGICTYLGDWHTHPAGGSQMSSLDRKTLAGIAASFDGALRPIMVVGGRNASAWSWQAHIHRASFMGRFWPRAKGCSLLTFTSH
jgi:integrative and conjugative element protein (TIGR02256 family)